jgi:23S rRNA (uracil1939-C5)-methyltransferase
MTDAKKQSYKSSAQKKTDTYQKQGIHSLCPVSGVCGGCQYIDIDYKEQLKKKQKYISGLLQPFGRVNEIVGMENPYNYRNKICATLRRKKNGDIISGKYEEGTHRVINTKSCLIEDKKADDIIQTITALIKSFKITVYNEDSGYGLMRHVLIRTGYSTGQLMVILVTSSPVFPSRKNFSKALLKAHPDITTIVQNINDKDTSMVLGERNQVIYGRGYIEDILCGKRFRISPNSFYQINPVQTEKLYNKAIEYAGLKENETVIDAYCGIGTIGIVASSCAKNVIGVELNNAAIKDARINSKMNNIKNISFYNNDAGRFMVGMAESGEHADVVFMDPPRSGSDEAFLSSVVKLSPRKVVYISCGPETLARDLKYLTKHGFKFVEATPVDLFPFTEHCETVALLVRERSDRRSN